MPSSEEVAIDLYGSEPLTRSLAAAPASVLLELSPTSVDAILDLSRF